MDGRRQPELFERPFLDQAERLAGMNDGWANMVLGRLHRAEREYGADSYLEHSLVRLLAEIDEEAQDISGWAVVAAEASYAKGLDDERAHALRIVLQEIASYGPLVHRLVLQAREALS